MHHLCHDFEFLLISIKDLNLVFKYIYSFCNYSFSKPGLELDSQFRLFLSSKPDVHFPLELLQLGLKVCFINNILSKYF